jgi:hypothetical protein
MGMAYFEMPRHFRGHEQPREMLIADLDIDHTPTRGEFRSEDGVKFVEGWGGVIVSGRSA